MAPKPVVSKITLTLFSDGTMGIEGPTTNELMFYGMVELAKARVAAHASQAAAGKAPLVVVPNIQGVPR